jgi:hypothetical protein
MHWRVEDPIETEDAELRVEFNLIGGVLRDLYDDSDDLGAIGPGIHVIEGGERDHTSKGIRKWAPGSFAFCSQFGSVRRV